LQEIKELYDLVLKSRESSVEEKRVVMQKVKEQFGTLKGDSQPTKDDTSLSLEPISARKTNLILSQKGMLKQSSDITFGGVLQAPKIT